MSRYIKNYFDIDGNMKSLVESILDSNILDKANATVANDAILNQAADEMHDAVIELLSKFRVEIDTMHEVSCPGFVGDPKSYKCYSIFKRVANIKNWVSELTPVLVNIGNKYHLNGRVETMSNSTSFVISTGNHKRLQLYMVCHNVTTVMDDETRSHKGMLLIKRYV